MTTNMNATDFIICCRRLVGALRQPPGEDGQATFFLGFDADGLPFYKAGSFHAGQLTSAFTEPLFFCPFCGRRVRLGGDDSANAAKGAARRALTEDRDEELTKLALEETREVETVYAPRRPHDTGARAGAGSFMGEAPAPHFRDFTSAGLANSDSGTGAFSSTFS